MIDQRTLDLLLQGVANVSWQSLVMLAIACVLMYLAIVRDYEHLLLLPIAAGCLLANLPLSPLIAPEGMLRILYDVGVGNELFPLLIFIGIGIAGWQDSGNTWTRALLRREGVEIEDARWFSLDNLPELPAPVSIAARLIAAGVAELRPQRRP